MAFFSGRRLNSLSVTKKFGRGGGFGKICFGYNFFGFYSIFSGIYQKKYYYGKPYISKSKFYRPTNPRTTAQQAWRAVFSASWVAWRALDSDTQEIYKKKGALKKMGGANLFISEYLKAHT